MHKFKTTAEVLDFLREQHAGDELRRHVMWAIKGTEEVNEYYDDSYVVFATNAGEIDEVEREFHISELTPEIDETISQVGYDDWHKVIFVFNDSGSGLVYFEKVPPGGQK